MNYAEISENIFISFLEWLNKEAPYWLLRGLQRIGLPQRGICTYFGSRVHISLWEYRKGESTRQGKRKTHFVEALHLPFAVGALQGKRKTCNALFVYSFLGSLFCVHNFQFRKHGNQFFIGRNFNLTRKNKSKNFISLVPDSRTPNSKGFSVRCRTCPRRN